MLKLFRNGKDIVDCECGWNQEYRYNSQDPSKLWEIHLAEIQDTSQELHVFKVEFRSHTNESFVICSCGWTEQLFFGQTASKVWEERHMSRRKRSRAQQPKRKWHTAVGEPAYRKVGSWGDRHGWDKIQPAAVEVFGGTFYAYSRCSTPHSESAT